VNHLSELALAKNSGSFLRRQEVNERKFLRFSLLSAMYLKGLDLSFK
jgi:hypothetical protein